MIDDEHHGLDEFREHLMDAAADHLARHYPHYVEYLRALVGQEVERAMESVPPPAVAVSFARYRELLTLTLDFGVSLHELAVLWRTSEHLPSEDELHALQLTPREWEDLLLDSWAIKMYSAYDRCKQVVSAMLRRFRRPYDKDWREVEKRLTRFVDHFRDLLWYARTPVAHGHGARHGLNRKSYWVLGAVHKFWPPIGPTLDVREQIHLTPEQRFEIYREGTRQLLWVVDLVFMNLDREIDWPKVRSDQGASAKRDVRSCPVGLFLALCMRSPERQAA